MSYNKYDREGYYSSEKISPRKSGLSVSVKIIIILSVTLALTIGFFVGFVIRSTPSLPVPTIGPSNSGSCPSNVDFGVPTNRVTQGDACAYALEGGQATIPAGWSIQWTPSPVDGYQHVEFVTSSSLVIAISGATVRKTDVYSLFSGDPFGDPSHPCRAAEKVVDASGNHIILHTNVVSVCSGRSEDQEISVVSS